MISPCCNRKASAIIVKAEHAAPDSTSEVVDGVSKVSPETTIGIILQFVVADCELCSTLCLCSKR